MSDSGNLHEASVAIGQLQKGMQRLEEQIQEKDRRDNEFRRERERKEEAFRKSMYEIMPTIKSTAMQIDIHSAELKNQDARVDTAAQLLASTVTTVNGHADKIAVHAAEIDALKKFRWRIAGMAAAVSVVSGIAAWVVSTYLQLFGSGGMDGR